MPAKAFQIIMCFQLCGNSSGKIPYIGAMVRNPQCFGHIVYSVCVVEEKHFYQSDKAETCLVREQTDKLHTGKKNQHSYPNTANDFFFFWPVWKKQIFFQACNLWNSTESLISLGHTGTDLSNGLLPVEVRLQQPLPISAVWKWAWWCGVVLSWFDVAWGGCSALLSRCRCWVELQQVVDLWPPCQV